MTSYMTSQSYMKTVTSKRGAYFFSSDLMMVWRITCFKCFLKCMYFRELKKPLVQEVLLHEPKRSPAAFFTNTQTCLENFSQAY